MSLHGGHDNRNTNAPEHKSRRLASTSAKFGSSSSSSNECGLAHLERNVRRHIHLATEERMELLANREAQGGEHSDARVLELNLSVEFDLPFGGVLGEANRVEEAEGALMPGMLRMSNLEGESGALSGSSSSGSSNESGGSSSSWSTAGRDRATDAADTPDGDSCKPGANPSAEEAHRRAAMYNRERALMEAGCLMRAADAGWSLDAHATSASHAVVSEVLLCRALPPVCSLYILLVRVPFRVRSVSFTCE